MSGPTLPPRTRETHFPFFFFFTFPRAALKRNVDTLEHRVAVDAKSLQVSSLWARRGSFPPKAPDLMQVARDCATALKHPLPGGKPIRGLLGAHESEEHREAKLGLGNYQSNRGAR